MFRGRAAITGARLVLGFVAALVVYQALLPAYTGGIVAVLRRTMAVWEPPDLRVHAVTRAGERILVHYSRRDAEARRPPGTVPLPEAFFWIDAGTVVWDFLVLATLFAGFATGSAARILPRAAAAIVALAALHVLAFGIVIRFGYDPELDRYDLSLATSPWIRDVAPVALWFLLCPMRLFAGRTPAPRPEG